MSTIRDVAVHARVSMSTVSRVMNGTSFVDPETEERVRRAVQILDYQPNTLARSLRQGTTQMLALIIPDNSNPFFAELARAIEDAGFAEGYSVILCNSDGSAVKESAYIQKLLAKQMDGFILISSQNSPEYVRSIINAKIPVVIVDRELNDDASVDSVATDNIQGGYLAGKCLKQLGHRRVGCIAISQSIKLTEDRMVGFRKALAEFGVELSEMDIAYGDFRYTGGEAAMHELLARWSQIEFRPSALFAINDVMAMGAMHAIRVAGLRIPEDISIIGFDDIEYSTLMSPPLTTIRQSIKEIGQQSVSLLLQRIKQRMQPVDPRHLILPATLIERKSCCVWEEKGGNF